MGHLTIYQDNYTNSTVISNRFIDEYMHAANDAQLKIYLYLIRMVSARLSTSISDIADKFNYTEKDVMRALKYWEKSCLLSLEYDDNKNVTGIHLMDFAPLPTTPVIAPVPAVSVPAPTVAPFASVVPISAKVNTADTAPAQNEDVYVKPNYTLDELKAFKSNEATSRLLFVAEQYLKKTLSANEVRTILFISDKLGFSEDLIDYLIQYCVDRGKKDLRYIEKVAISWAQQGISTPKQAARLAGKYDKAVYAIMKALGKNDTPTQTEVSYITRWTKEYGFTMDIIFAACERTVLATDKHRFEYADSILSNWFKANVHHKGDIQSLDEHYHKTRAAKTVSGNKFNQFKQNNYDFDILEQELLSN
ncbi:MAG: DnaD domain protein [Lachnospiraceae bacterium]|nr:DnaD domain protein [Lachnospiraceae bacterium]